MKRRTILHSDINNFFASVECANNEELKNLPVAVAGNPKKRTGVILAKNEIAKKYGVKTGQTIYEAKSLCPELVTLLPHYDLYEEISEKLQELYLTYTDYVEPLGLDECWLDVTDSLKYLKKTGEEIALEIRTKIKEKFNITASVGVSFSKIFAKLGSDMKKPDATTVIPYEKFKEMTYSLPLNSIIGIGRRLEAKFAKMNINTIGDFVLLDDDFIQEIMSIAGVNLKHRLLGEEVDEVLNYFALPPPKSIGNGTTTLKDIIRRDEIAVTVSFLCDKVASRLVKHHVLANCLGVSLKTFELKRVAKSRKISPTHDAVTLKNEALKIIDSMWRYNTPIRAIRVRTSNFSSDSYKQMSLFDKDGDLQISINQINNKYGHIALVSEKSSFINSNKHSQE